MKRDMKQWINSIKMSDEKFAMPILTYPGLQLTSKSIMDVINDGETQYHCIEVLAKKYPAVATVTIMDLSVESEAFGSPVKFSNNEVPTVTGKIVEDMESVLALKIPKVGAGRTMVYIRAAELSGQNISDKPVFGGHIGPYSLAGRLFDMTEIMIAIALEPDIVKILLEKCTKFLIEYCNAFKKAGANGVIIAEPAAGLLSPAMCKEFSSQYVKQIVDSVQDDNFMVILHNCGNTNLLVDSMVETGAMGLHFGNAVNMSDIMPQIPNDRLVFGNIDPVGILKNGSEENVRQATFTLLEQMSPFNNFVLSTGCDVPPGTPIKNIDAFYKALSDYNDPSFNTKYHKIS